MNKKAWISSARLTAEGLQALAEIAEHAHAGIAPDLFSKRKSRTTGIAGFVHRTLQAGLKASASVFRHAEKHAGNGPGDALSSTGDPVFAAILNGVAGDYLAETGSAWALPMQLRLRNPDRALSVAEAARLQTGTFCLMIHGLCMHEGNWDWNGTDTGAFVASSFEMDVRYLRYNSGLAVAANGAALSRLLDTLDQELPPDKKLVFLAHSMGGLLIRAALHAAGKNGSTWPQRVSSVVFLGTPHNGSPVERAGHLFERTLAFSSYSAPFKRLGRLRSKGITDLRHGRITEDLRPPDQRFSDDATLPEHVPLPAGPAFYALAADLSTTGLGDGLVTVSSALGQSDDRNRHLHIPEDHTAVLRPVGHFDMISHPETLSFMKTAWRKWIKKFAPD